MPIPLPKIASAVQPSQKKGLGTRALESTVLTTVEGANQMTKSLAQPISRAMEWKQRDATKAKDGEGTKTPKGWRETWNRAKEVVLGDQEKVKKDALANAHQHSKSTLHATNRIKDAADRAIAAANDNSKRIRPNLNGAEKTAAKVLGMAPDLLLSGPSKARIVANRVSSAAQHYGDHKSIAGAMGELLIPGNSKLGNIASNVATDYLEARKAARKIISYGAK